MPVICAATILAILALSTLFLGDNPSFDTIFWIYLIGTITTAFFVTRIRAPMAEFFRPSFIMVMYVLVFFSMGAWAYSRGLVLDVAGRQDLYQFSSLGFTTGYVLLSLSLILFTSFFVDRRRREKYLIEFSLDPRTRSPQLFLFSCIVGATAAIIAFVKGDSAEIVDIAHTIFTFTALHISLVLKSLNSRLRWLAYLLVSITFASAFYNDRRLLPFYIFSVLFLEGLTRPNLKISINKAIVFVGISGLAIAAIITMSIRRGVGQFNPETATEAVQYFFDYVRSDWAVAMALHNLEGPPSMFHTYDVINYAHQAGDYLYGSTIIKVLFLPIPRTWYPEKPNSMVYEYTDRFYPHFRDIGGSWVPNLLAEGFWNFGFIGALLFLGVLFFLFDKLFFWGLCQLRTNFAPIKLWFLGVVFYMIFFFRGCGLDLYIFYCSCFVILSILYSVIQPGKSGATRSNQ